MRGALARSSSAASGFFFCGMIEEPEDHASGSSQKPTSCARPQHELGAQAREVGGAGRGGVQVVQREVAVGDGVDRVGHDVVEAELAGDHAAVGVEVDARQRAGAERQAPGLLEREGEALAVAGEHPEVGEQVVAEVDRLGALQVGVAGQRPVDVLLGAVPAARPSARPAASWAARACARTYIATSVAT